MPYPAGIEADDVQGQAILAILGVVGGLVENRVYPNAIPEEVKHTECLRVALVDDPSFYGLSGATGTARALLQVDVFGDYKDRVNYLAKQAKLLLMNPPGGLLGALPVMSTAKLGEFDEGYFPDDGSDRFRYRRVLRFEVVHCEDVP